MLGPYALIIVLFSLASLVVAIWSYRKMSSAKASLQWPSTKGEVIVSELDENKLPTVEYRYTAAGQDFTRPVSFSEDITSAPNGPQSCLAQYPMGCNLDVFYEPANPRNTTLQPGPAKEDKLIFYVGVAGFLFGLALIIFIE